MEKPDSQTGPVQLNRQCPACGATLKTEFSEGPKCGVIVEKFLKKIAKKPLSKDLPESETTAVNYTIDSYFRVDKDGRKIFRPGGLNKPGYIVSSNRQFQRLRREQKIWDWVFRVAVGALCVIAEIDFTGGLWMNLLVGFVALIFLCLLGQVFYNNWVRRRCSRLEKIECQGPRKSIGIRSWRIFNE